MPRFRHASSRKGGVKMDENGGEKPYTTIRVSRETWKALMQRGCKGSTFDEIIRKLLEAKEKVVDG